MDRSLKKLVFVLVVFTLYSCHDPEDVEFVSITNVNVTGTEGRFIMVNVDAILFNPNKVKGKVKSVDISVLYKDKEVALVKQVEVTRVSANSNFSVPLEMAVDMDKINNDIFSSLSSILSNKGIKLRFVGDVRVSIHGIAYKVPVDYVESITF